MTDAEFEALVNDSLEYMAAAIDACNLEWDFQSYGRWDLDLDRRVLVFSDGTRPSIECDVQVAGIFMKNRSFWRWAWDNPSLEPALWAKLDVVRTFGKANEIPEINVGGCPVEDEEAAWAMTALAAKLVGAKSVYRAPDEPRHVFCLITDIRWADSK